MAHHRAGRTVEAERIYHDVLKASPCEADALNLLGLVAASRAQYEKAASLITRAAELRPERGDFHAALGNVYSAQGEDGRMVECYRRALLLTYLSEIPASIFEIVAHAGGHPAVAGFQADPNLYASQHLQDVFLDRWVFGGLRSGIFVDIGAYDGTTYSNSVDFERARAWSGICIEPNPDVFKQLAANRRSVNLQCCVGARFGLVAYQKISGQSEMLSGVVEAYHTEHRARIARELRKSGGAFEVIAVEERRLTDIAAQYGIAEIHYLSIDTEGSEMEILQSIDFGRLFVHALTVEVNYESAKSQTIALMRENGFERVMTLSDDFVFINRASAFHALHAKARAQRFA